MRAESTIALAEKVELLHGGYELGRVGVAHFTRLSTSAPLPAPSSAIDFRRVRPTTVVAGDHTAIVWPVLFGVAKAKYYLMTADFIDGREAERIGLVSLCVPAEQLMEGTLSTVSRLAQGSQTAIRATKKALKNWMRLAGPILDNSLELEMLGFLGSDVREGVAAARDRRAPTFPRPPARAEPSARITLFKGAVSRLRHPAD
jgi:hypothetical protein